MLPFPLLRAAPSGPSLSGGVPDAHSERWIIPQGIQKGEKTSVVQNMIASLTLVDKLQSRQAKVGIIGLGYVGLPLAVAFAEAGFSVLGIDSDEARVISLNAG